MAPDEVRRAGTGVSFRLVERKGFCKLSAINYQSAIDRLYTLAPPFHQFGAKAYKPGLSTMHSLVQAMLGVVPDAEGTIPLPYRIIHVAGTNGKGSTAHLIASALAAAGMKVGLYTSPHLVSFTERLRVISREQAAVSCRQVAEQWVTEFVEQQQSVIESLSPSFFEVATAMAFLWFAEQQVDIAVVEVGLGGLLDATNIVRPDLCVITNIGLDHTDLLGLTLEAIAEQKAGIIKPSVPCVIGQTHPDTESVFIAIAAQRHASVIFADQCEYLRRQRLSFAPECELHGDYQQYNIQTAFVALRSLASLAAPIVVPHERIAEGFAHVMRYTGLRGRWETLAQSPLTICDTGHNGHGVATYVDQLRRSGKRLHIVFGMVADKDVDTVLKLLPAEAAYYFTQPDSHRALPADELLHHWQLTHPMEQEGASSILSRTVYTRVIDALEAAMAAARPDDMIFIGGSNYLVGEVLRYFEHS